MPRAVYGADPEARAVDAFPPWLLGERAELTTGLESLVDDWAGFHLIKAVCAALLAALALYAGHRAVALIPVVLLIPNIQGAVAPLSSAFSLLDPVRVRKGELGRALALTRAELQATPSGPVRALVDDFARYHLAMVVMAGALTAVLVVFAGRAWRQGRRRWAVATLVAAVVAGVVTAANVTNTLDPAGGLLGFIGGS